VGLSQAMRSFSERDVRRHYDLLQHRPELGLTQLKAMEGLHLFGVGLFDNEEDFVSECRRYNGLGTLTVGVNPRGLELLDQFGGLRNRMRSLFRDVVEPAHIHWITGVAATASMPLASSALPFSGEATRLQDGEAFFALDEPISVHPEEAERTEGALGEWLFGERGDSVPLIQFTQVMGAALPYGGWFRSRARFKRYRPYIQTGITESIEGIRGTPGAPSTDE